MKGINKVSTLILEYYKKKERKKNKKKTKEEFLPFSQCRFFFFSFQKKIRAAHYFQLARKNKNKKQTKKIRQKRAKF
jgi:hypothetical protein